MDRNGHQCCRAFDLLAPSRSGLRPARPYRSAPAGFVLRNAGQEELASGTDALQIRRFVFQKFVFIRVH
jgi:hypothetical protein